ncbi:MAG TPA: DUF1015 domain-containing protein [Streptosporangiaceae bacterium]|nr:DUF1015 domain-containing protein [Streptosporangiaceae bacterium]
MAPFRGVRYAPGRVSGLAEVTSPPYDVIAHDIEDQLIAADPHNVVRLILPRSAAGPPGENYQDAARTLRQWQDERILVPDQVPGLYVYEQALPGRSGALQRGLIGALRLIPPEAGTVLPHEDVVPGPVTGRRQLMEATQANLEPIFLLYDGSRPGAATRLAEDVATGREPLVEALTEDAVRHRLWAVTGPAEIAAVAADLAPRQALIADGHHRYAAYRQLQERRRARAGRGGPWDYGLALLVDSAAYPPRIGAIHRVIPGLAPATAVGLAKAAFCVRPLPGGTQDMPAALGALSQAARNGGVAFLVAGGGEAHLLSEPDPVQLDAAMPPGRSPRWRGLAASVLQELLMTRVWGVRDDERSVRIVHHDAALAVRAADQAPGGTAVICTALSAADVYAVAANGERVPRKSTSFGPKPRTGLVIRTFAQG